MTDVAWSSSHGHMECPVHSFLIKIEFTVLSHEILIGVDDLSLNDSL